MSNPKTAIQEIKKLMKQFGFLADGEVTMASFKLEDNTIVETPELKVGNKITKISEDFERVVLEDGSYRLVENFELEVKNGEIVSVKEIFVDAKLVDGTPIKVEGEEVIEGAKVVVVTEEAEVPAPDGVHELEDGSKVETKDGVIVKVEGPKEEEPEAEVEIEVKSEDMGDGMKELYSLLEDMMKKVSEKMKNMEEKMSSIENQFKSFKKEPAGKKISDGKTEFNKQENIDSLDARIASIMSMRKK
jgi:hypothetical protein